jgi:GxxExxY protein
MDFVVEAAVVVELKCVERVLPIHEAQLLTYLKLSRKRVGLLLNFNASVLREGKEGRAP